MLGYGISSFDLPILISKMNLIDQQHKKSKNYPEWYWPLVETLRRACVIDLSYPVSDEISRYEKARGKFLSLENALQHERFKGLKFKNAKHIISDLMEKGAFSNKWEAVHYLWENDGERFKEYIEGDVYDTLLLAEELFARSKF